MGIVVDGKTYYRTAEVCKAAGISRTTLFRWLKENILSSSVHRDRRGWRLFTEEELSRIKNEANRVVTTDFLKELDIPQNEFPVVKGSKS